MILPGNYLCSHFYPFVCVCVFVCACVSRLRTRKTFQQQRVIPSLLKRFLNKSALLFTKWRSSKSAFTPINSPELRREHPNGGHGSMNDPKEEICLNSSWRVGTSLTFYRGQKGLSLENSEKSPKRGSQSLSTPGLVTHSTAICNSIAAIPPYSAL